MRGYLTHEQWQEKLADCCYEYGFELSIGDGVDDCVDATGEPVYAPAPPRGPLTQAPRGPSEATLAPVPPPIATVAPSLPPAQAG